MPKPERAKLSTRKPADQAALDAFLQGKVAPPPAPSPPASGRVIHKRKDGREIRRTTILMVADLAQRIDVFCARRGVDKTKIVHLALEKYLDEQGDG